MGTVCLPALASKGLPSILPKASRLPKVGMPAVKPLRISEDHFSKTNITESSLAETERLVKQFIGFLSSIDKEFYKTLLPKREPLFVSYNIPNRDSIWLDRYSEILSVAQQVGIDPYLPVDRHHFRRMTNEELMAVLKAKGVKCRPVNLRNTPIVINNTNEKFDSVTAFALHILKHRSHYQTWPPEKHWKADIQALKQGDLERFSWLKSMDYRFTEAGKRKSDAAQAGIEAKLKAEIDILESEWAAKYPSPKTEMDVSPQKGGSFKFTVPSSPLLAKATSSLPFSKQRGTHVAVIETVDKNSDLVWGYYPNLQQLVNMVGIGRYKAVGKNLFQIMTDDDYVVALAARGILCKKVDLKSSPVMTSEGKKYNSVADLGLACAEWSPDCIQDTLAKDAEAKLIREGKYIELVRKSYRFIEDGSGPRDPAHVEAQLQEKAKRVLKKCVYPWY